LWGRTTCVLVIEELGRRKEYTLGLGTLSFPSKVDFESESSKVGVCDEIDSCSECVAI
jgi:hypothetical protein